MGIKVQDVIEKMEKFAPSSLKEDFDNVGLMVGDINAEVNKILLALDCTKEVIDEAIEKKCEMIITHHPLIFKKMNSIIKGDLVSDKIIKLIQNNIAVYSSHTNLDSVENGINSTITRMLGFNKFKVMDKTINNQVGIGRFIKLDEEMQIEELIGNLKTTLEIESLKGYIGKDKIKNIAIINGSGSSYFKMAYEMGADCIITGDVTYHYMLDYKELGLTIIDAGHFNTEWKVFLEVMKNITCTIENVEFINSIKTVNPYEIL